MGYAEVIHQMIVEKSDPKTANAWAHEGYTGSGHIHYGLSAPTMRAMIGEWMAAHRATLTFEEWIDTLDGLYHGESIDEKIAAGMLLARFPKYRVDLPLIRLGSWLGQLHGWSEVDGTCQSTFTSEELLGNWDGWSNFLRQLARDTNINKRRASLVLLVRPLRESDDARLLALAFEQIDRLKAEKDKLITKAISWLLREGVKQHKTAIADYLEANRAALPAIAVRETTTKLKTGKK